MHYFHPEQPFGFPPHLLSYSSAGPRSQTSQEEPKQSSSDSLKLLPNPRNERGPSLARILPVPWQGPPYALARLDPAQERLQLPPDTALGLEQSSRSCSLHKRGNFKGRDPIPPFLQAGEKKTQDFYLVQLLQPHGPSAASAAASHRGLCPWTPPPPSPCQ